MRGVRVWEDAVTGFVPVRADAPLWPRSGALGRLQRSLDAAGTAGGADEPPPNSKRR